MILSSKKKEKKKFQRVLKNITRASFLPFKETLVKRSSCGPPSSSSVEKSSRRDEGDEFYFIASMGEQPSGSSGWNMFRIIIEG